MIAAPAAISVVESARCGPRSPPRAAGYGSGRVDELGPRRGALALGYAILRLSEAAPAPAFGSAPSAIRGCGGGGRKAAPPGPASHDARLGACNADIQVDPPARR